MVVEGGTNTIRTVLEYVTEEPPVRLSIFSISCSLIILLQVSVVVIDGSGRAADLIAFTYKHTQNNAYD